MSFGETGGQTAMQAAFERAFDKGEANEPEADVTQPSFRAAMADTEDATPIDSAISADDNRGNVRQIDKKGSTAGGAVPSTVAGRGSLTSHSASDNRIPTFGGKNNPQNLEASSNKLERELDRVLANTFPKDTDEVYIGETSNFLVNTIGARSLPVLMPSAKAYSAMVTAEQAKADGRYSEDTNYHGLGKAGLLTALEASENPVAAFAALPDVDDNNRSNRIVLVTDQTLNGEPIIVIEEMETNAIRGGRRITANKQITVYPRAQIVSDILAAANEDRLLHLDKKRSQRLDAGRSEEKSPMAIRRYAGVPGSNSLAAIRNVDYTNNIRRFWENVNWKKTGKREMSFGETGGQTAMQAAFERAFDKGEANEPEADVTQPSFRAAMADTEDATPRRSWQNHVPLFSFRGCGTFMGLPQSDFFIEPSFKIFVRAV